MRAVGSSNSKTSFGQATHRVTELQVQEQKDAAERQVAQTPGSQNLGSEDTAGRRRAPNPPRIGTRLDISV